MVTFYWRKRALQAFMGSNLINLLYMIWPSTQHLIAYQSNIFALQLKQTKNRQIVNAVEEKVNDWYVLQRFFFFFFYLDFLSRTFTIHRQQGKGEAVYLSPLYHFHPFHRHLDISGTIIAESSPLHIDSSRTRNKNLWFPSASR